MCRCWSRLKARYFHTEISQCGCLTLPKLIVNRIGSLYDVARESQRIAKYQVRRRRADVGFEGCSDRKKRERKLPIPVLGLIVAESNQGFLESAMEAFD